MGGVTQNLLGEDFYVKYKCNWDHDNSEFVVKFDPDEGERTNKIFCAETMEINAGQEAIIPSYLSYVTEDDGLPMCLQKFVQAHELVIARALISARDRDVCIRVYNPGVEPVEVRRGTVIALFTPVQCVSEPISATSDVNVVRE